MPDWVEHAPYPSQTPESGDDCISNGVCRLLYETQVDLRQPEHVWHYRTAQRVLTRAGAERASQFAVEFDPGYERLDVHFIRILRGEDVLEHANAGAIQAFRRETSMERMVFDGRLTATLLIPDMRVDDIVECSFTLYSAHPVLGGKHAGWATFDCFGPWQETRHRLVRSTATAILTKEFNDPPAPQVIEKDGVEDSRWQLAGQKRREFEECTPPWLVLAPALQYTTFKNWNEVARLFAPLYDKADIPGPLAEEIDQLSALHPDPADFAVEWLRFVQQRLRYFALALGEGGLVPSGLEMIWARRFGDCKDAAKLYVAGARRVGLDACAALTSTTHGQALVDFLPGPNMFNHCIVRLRLSGVSYWLDPTCSTQSGALGTVFQPHAGWALPLTNEVDRLEQLSDGSPLHLLHVQEELHFAPERHSPAKLRRQIEFFSGFADDVRNRIANEGSAEYARSALKEVTAIWPDVTEILPMEIRDDQVKNSFTTIHTYEIRNGWKAANGLLNFEAVDSIMVRELLPLAANQRHADIYLGRPRKFTSSMFMHMPRTWSGDGWDREDDAPGIRFVNRLGIKERTIENTRELAVEAWSIPAKHVSDYNEVVGQLRQNSTFIRAKERFGKVHPPPGSGWGFNSYFPYVIFAVVTLLIALARGLVGQPPRQTVEPVRPPAAKAWQPPSGTNWPSPNSGTVLPRQ